MSVLLGLGFCKINRPPKNATYCPMRLIYVLFFSSSWHVFWLVRLVATYSLKNTVIALLACYILRRANLLCYWFLYIISALQHIVISICGMLEFSFRLPSLKWLLTKWHLLHDSEEESVHFKVLCSFCVKEFFFLSLNEFNTVAQITSIINVIDLFPPHLCAVFILRALFQKFNIQSRSTGDANRSLWGELMNVYVLLPTAVYQQ